MKKFTEKVEFTLLNYEEKSFNGEDYVMVTGYYKNYDNGYNTCKFKVTDKNQQIRFANMKPLSTVNIYLCGSSRKTYENEWTEKYECLDIVK